VLQAFRGSIRAFTLPKRLCEDLRGISQREGVSLFMTLLAGFAALLYRYTKQEDIIVGTVAPAGRKQTEVQQLLGYFLNPVALRIDLSGDPTVRDLLRRSREVTVGALSNDDVPLEYLVRELKPKSDPSHYSLFQMMITLAPPMSKLDSGWSQTPMDVDNGGAKCDLYVELNERPIGIIGRAQYNTDIFTPETISQMLHDFETVLGGLALNSGQRISNLPNFCLSAPAPIRHYQI
jgi:surfactin family lipopeptide synthetase A